MSEKKQEINKRLTQVFHDVFDDEDIQIFDEMSAKDLEEWDSLMHITLVVATEKKFGVQLNAAEVGQLKNVGEMIELLMKRT